MQNYERQPIDSAIYNKLKTKQAFHRFTKWLETIKHEKFLLIRDELTDLACVYSYTSEQFLFFESTDEIHQYVLTQL